MAGIHRLTSYGNGQRMNVECAMRYVGRGMTPVECRMPVVRCSMYEVVFPGLDRNGTVPCRTVLIRWFARMFFHRTCTNSRMAFLKPPITSGTMAMRVVPTEMRNQSLSRPVPKAKKGTMPTPALWIR